MFTVIGSVKCKIRLHVNLTRIAYYYCQYIIVIKIIICLIKSFGQGTYLIIDWCT